MREALSRLADRLPPALWPIRTRFLAVHLLLVAVPVAGVGFARFHEREMLAALERDMIHQGRVLAETLLADPTGPRLDEREALLRAVAGRTRTRIRLLDASGTLRADSHRDGPPEGVEAPPPRLPGVDSLLPPAPEPSAPRRSTTPADSLAERPDVRAALHGRYGSASRLYRNGHRLFLFSALPVVGKSGGLPLGVVYLTRSTNPVRAAMYRLRTSLLEIFAAVAVLATVVSLFLAATISRPLARLTRAAGAVAAGDAGAVLRLDRRDEIGQLSRAFAAMMEKLDARAREAAERAADLSHEFKSPLTGIRGAAELLLDGAADDPQARARFLRNIVSDSRRLDRLVTRLLELSRMEADDAPPSALDWEAAVRETCAAYEERPVDVVWEAQARTVRGRRAHLASALANLVDNALQHAEPGTRVRVRVASTPNRLRTEVHNEGAAVPHAVMARVWDRFFTTRADCGGSGLGLSIVRAAVASHGGTCGAESRAGEGTTFWFELPA